MRTLYFIYLNCKVFLGVVLGLLLGYIYWHNFGLVWGTLPLSSEWWVNCVYGGLFGGLIGSFFSKK